MADECYDPDPRYRGWVRLTPASWREVTSAPTWEECRVLTRAWLGVSDAEWCVLAACETPLGWHRGGPGKGNGVLNG